MVRKILANSIQEVTKVFFLGYSLNFRTYRIFNRKNLTVKESSHVLFDESMSSLQTNMNNDDFDAENTTRKHDQHHDFLDEVKLEEE